VAAKYRRLKGRLTRIVGNEAIAFAKSNFRKQGFEGYPGRINKWKKRKGGARDKGRAILVDTGTGRRSIRVGTVTPTTVAITTDTDYMGAHNDGGVIKVKANVRQHRRRTRKGHATVKAHTRQMNTRVTKRQFIGPSEELNRLVGRRYNLELIKCFK
jgi:hypothetical protein